MSTEEVMLSFSSDHPVGAGHFPGNPIIPGALLLAETVSLIGRAAGLQFDSCNIKSAKFFHPVRPGDAVQVEYSVGDQQEIRFQCAVAGTRVLSGVLDAASHK
jgi:3-hydroxyacyl-[acyl-carrier-protein] dehydratase